MTLTKKLWIGIIVLILFSPIGLILPDHFKAGSAWGEWGSEEIQELVGYIPHGLEKLSSLWNAPIPDYAFQGWEEKGLSDLSFAYVFSAVLGIAVTVGIVFVLGKILLKKDN
jgi:cobalt/nickel transport protein